MEQLKQCSKCLQNKPIDEFYRSRRLRWKRRGECKNCENTRHDLYYRERKKAIHYKAYLRQGLYRRKAIKYLGSKCNWCGFKKYRALVIDHVNDDGAKELAVKGNNKWRIWKTILAGNIEKRYQILCANCNMIKHWKYRRNVDRKEGKEGYSESI